LHKSKKNEASLNTETKNVQTLAYVRKTKKELKQTAVCTRSESRL